MANGQLIAGRSPAASGPKPFYRLNVIDNGDGTCFVYVEDRANSDGVSTPAAVTATGLQIVGVAGGGVSGSGTANRVSKFTSASVIGNSSISDDGTSISATEPWAARGLLINDLWDASNAFSIFSVNIASSNLQAGALAGNVPATTGSFNTAFGEVALAAVTSGVENIAMGSSALAAMLAGGRNTALGVFSMINATSGSFNTAVGRGSLNGGAGASGSQNVSVGYNSLFRYTSGADNVALGTLALERVTTGQQNVAIGTDAGANITTVNGGVFIGYNAGQAETAANKLYIANSNTATPLIGGDFSAQTLQLNGTGGVTNYKGRVTAGAGLTSIRGFTSQKAETAAADANVLTVTPPAAAGTYRVAVAISVSSATSGVISWTLSYKDSNGNAVTTVAQQIFQQGTAAPNTTFTTSAAGNYYGSVVIDIDNSATNIVVGWVGGGTSAAKMSASIEQLN